ncbi:MULTISPECIES: alkaline phosphatase [unclassified Corynebacterium]|uniref:alkaline phosphatase n=1 Tax=unclassified Corynebacterium TaxID=2624378 RepID=UPI0029CA364A|nr:MULTISPECIES: alkaline phosphatase [unclassified Corynebacterium]WPF65538.1 alkaline phosphatase [Corynebacterium sp. 22KM0430]WPF68033.1 alkaline phosphatase [Corynebacterium sp. 21KM1197]
MSYTRRILPTAAVLTSLALIAGCSSADNSDTAAQQDTERQASESIAPVSQAEAAYDRSAAGNVAEHGGARRLREDQAASLQEAVSKTGAKNVILLIGDGMGDSEITSARNYSEGAGGSFKGLDALPVTGQYTHYSVDKDGKPDYVTDSAASGSAWATGTKTYNGAISVDKDGKDQESILERAKKAGLATGNVSTAEIQDATPAVQAAHVSDRSCYDPESTAEECPENALENGGRGSISEQILETRADVTLGGGAESFEAKARAGEYKDKTLLEQARERGYQLPTNAEELSKITEANQDKPVLGLFSEGNMPVRWEGPKAAKGGYLEEAATCTDNPERTSEVPLLADMTSKAIDLLKDKEEGFFLQVEGASIDKQDHAANPCGQIGETVDLDEAVQKALEFAKADGETLVVVTADHAHSSQIVPNEDEEEEGLYPGLTRKLRTKEGAEMTLSYATSDDIEESQQHTGTQLRIAAFGPNSANVAGLSDQTDLFFTVTEALGI